MATSAVFPTVPARAGSYESFYLRAVSPDEPLGIWIRHTVHKPPGKRASGSVWCTVFDGRAEAPFQHKITTQQLRVPDAGWIEIGNPGAAASRGVAVAAHAGAGATAGEGGTEGSGSIEWLHAAGAHARSAGSRSAPTPSRTRSH